MREADFSECTFNGAYLEKAVAYRTNFEGVLMFSPLLCSHFVVHLLGHGRVVNNHPILDAGADLSDTLMDRMVGDAPLA